MQRFAVNYYKDGFEDPTYCHVIECEGVEQALRISKLAATSGEFCVLLTSDSNQFEMYRDLRAAVLALADDLHKEAQARFKDYSIGDDSRYDEYSGGMVSGLSTAAGKLFDLLRQYR